MSRYSLNLVVAFFAMNIAFDLIGLLSASKPEKAEEKDPEDEKGYGRLSPWALPLVPFSVAYSIVCFIISYAVLALFRSLSLFLAFLRFIGLVAANETKSSMLWSLAAARSLSGSKADSE